MAPACQHEAVEVSAVISQRHKGPFALHLLKGNCVLDSTGFSRVAYDERMLDPHPCRVRLPNIIAVQRAEAAPDAGE